MSRTRRTILLAAALTLAFAALALAEGSATLSVTQDKARSGTVATLELSPPRQDRNPSFVALRTARGVKFDPRAVSRRCKDAEARKNACPSASRIGGGDADVTVKQIGRFTVAIDLYLTHKRRSGDVAGVVAIADARGLRSHAFGRVRHLHYRKLDLETRFTGLGKAFKAPKGFETHINHLHLRFGKHRRVHTKNGVIRYDLIRNPSSCTSEGWRYAVLVGYAQGGGVNHFDGAIDCSS